MSAGAARTASIRLRSASTECRGGDQSDPTGDASLPHASGLPRRNPWGDAAVCITRRLPKNFLEDRSQLPQAKETRANRGSQSQQRIHVTNCYGNRGRIINQTQSGTAYCAISSASAGGLSRDSVQETTIKVTDHDLNEWGGLMARYVNTTKNYQVRLAGRRSARRGPASPPITIPA